MSHQTFDEQSGRTYTLTLFISFAVLFCFAVLMMLWQGLYHPDKESAVRVYTGSVDQVIRTEHQASHSDSIHYAR